MIHEKLHSVKVALLFLAIVAATKVSAQDWKSDERINVLFGLSQIIASGFNIEGNYINNRFIFDYSHGVSLDFKDNRVTSDLRRQEVAVHMPWTTGFGVGYRFTEWLNIRVEPKWHRFEFYYEDESQNVGNQITAYETFSLGVGLYGSYRPFKNKRGFLNGLMISPSIRFWPTVYSSLKDDKFIYFNKNTLKDEAITTLDPGIGFTPLVVNVSIGYSFRIR
ncbi:MAG TPA: hypothetical protein VGI43_08285 [Mucilaginibacter sp.]|jgi:hypothetical protein